MRSFNPHNPASRRGWSVDLGAGRIFSAALALVLAMPAVAHHGWSWTTGENVELTGTITAARLGNPHGELDLDVDGEIYTVEVGQPWRNARSGLEDGDLARGTEVTVSGEVSDDTEARVLKVERLWLEGEQYELYPGRE
ncbi:MAG: DUF6152 family protein [Halofilum sp. (in: g-proteobacteria)]